MVKYLVEKLEFMSLRCFTKDITEGLVLYEKGESLNFC